MEVWRNIHNFNGIYEISNHGRVKSNIPQNFSQRTLSDDDVKRIHTLSNDGYSSRFIASDIGISQPVVSKIIRGAAYKNNTRILAHALRRDGYLFVTLTKDAKHYHKTIHSMVAEAFIGFRPPDRFINHKDGNKTNNVVNNLEYVSKKGNSQHSLYELENIRKLNLEQAKDIWYGKKRGDSKKDLAVKHDISVHMVSAIWEGKSWWHAR